MIKERIKEKPVGKKESPAWARSGLRRKELEPQLVRAGEGPKSPIIAAEENDREGTIEENEQMDLPRGTESHRKGVIEDRRRGRV